MAYRGKLVTVQEALGEAPNGSGFVVTLGPAPGLDSTNLVVGRVTDGMELVRHLCTPTCPTFVAKQMAGSWKSLGSPLIEATVAQRHWPLRSLRVAHHRCAC